MNKLYNTENDIVKGLIDFFNKIDFNFSKPQLKIIDNMFNEIVKERDTIKFRIVKKSPKFLFNRRLIRKKRIINKRFRDI